jgi:hypothetical protein
MNYECGAWFEPAALAANGEGRKDGGLAWFGIYERGYRIESQTGQFIDELPSEIEAKLEALRARLAAPELAQNSKSTARIDADFAIGVEDYASRIATIHEWI